jgi:hypothetical protein
VYPNNSVVLTPTITADLQHLSEIQEVIYSVENVEELIVISIKLKMVMLKQIVRILIKQK